MPASIGGQVRSRRLPSSGPHQQEWLKQLIETQADITRDIANSYTSTARSLLEQVHPSPPELITATWWANHRCL